MSDRGAEAAPQKPGRRAARRRAAASPGEGTGWAVVSYLIGGMAALRRHRLADRAVDGFAVLFPVGMMLGLALALALIIFRFTRP